MPDSVLPVARVGVHFSVSLLETCHDKTAPEETLRVALQVAGVGDQVIDDSLRRVCVRLGELLGAGEVALELPDSVPV